MSAKSSSVSIVVPIYNVEKYLRQCIDSITSQSFGNLEIILIDDGSDDRSEDIVEEYRKRDDRIITVHQKNRGLSGARNIGADIASGEFIWFIDSDDYIEKDSVRMLYERASKGYDLILLDGDTFVEKGATIAEEDRNKFYWKSPPIVKCRSGQEMFIELFRNKTYYSSIPLMFFRTKFLNSIQLRFTEGYIHEDLKYAFLSMSYARNVSVINEKMYKRRVRQNSIYFTEKSHRNFEGRFVAYQENIKHMPDDGSREYYAAAFEYLYIEKQTLIETFKTLSLEEKKKISFGDDEGLNYAFNLFLDEYAGSCLKIFDPIRYQSKIIIFGAGKIGKALLEKTGNKSVYAFIDNDDKKEEINGIPVMNFNEFINHNLDFPIVVAMANYAEAVSQLRQHGIFEYYLVDNNV